VLVTSTGDGFSQRRDLDVTRWQADTTLDPHGTFFYARGLGRDTVWSATH